VAIHPSGDWSLSLEWNQAHANQTIDMSRAVAPLAVARSICVPEANASSHIVLFRRRFSRLRVLMNPILPCAWSIGTWPALSIFEIL
jgi:hypothetical protein